MEENIQKFLHTIFSAGAAPAGAQQRRIDFGELLGRFLPLFSCFLRTLRTTGCRVSACIKFTGYEKEISSGGSGAGRKAS